MKKDAIWRISTLVISIAAICIAIWSFKKTPRVGYVRTPELVYSYLGTREAKRSFEDEKSVLLANLDTLKRIHLQLISEFEQLPSTSEEKEMKQAEALRAGNNVRVYEKSIRDKADEMDGELMTGVLNQVNSFAMEFGKENGYDLILGTTSSGSLLYGREADDLTLDMLEQLNNRYTGVE